MSNSISKRLPYLIILGLLVALAAYLNWPSAEQEQQRRQRVVSVKVVEVQKADFRDVIEALGSVRANEQVLITSKYADFVDYVSFTDGQLVKKNDILVQFNNKEEAAKVSEMEANLAESVAQLNRFQDLLKKKAASKSTVDEQEAKAKAIAAQLLIAKTKLNELTIRAPFDGVLGFRDLSAGAYVKAGDVITSLDDLSKVKVDFNVPERFYTTITVGQKVEAKNTAYGDRLFEGVVISVDPRIDNVTRTVSIRAEIPNSDFALRSGMLLSVSVERRVDNVLQLPESAIIPIEEKNYVYVVEGEKAVMTEVVVGRRKPGIVEIKQGISEGQAIVIEGALKLRDGSQVKVLEQ
ncbi:efflux RND transporter periplasmic adaptor subunit [Colwellia sp. MEBiC06753]